MMMQKLVFLGLVASTLAATDWDNFKSKFNKKYSSASEEILRASIFNSNLKKINDHNLNAAKGRETYTLSTNGFADLTPAEFAQKFNGFSSPRAAQSAPSAPTFDTLSLSLGATTLPASVNWTAAGYVTPVKNQKQCGSCYSFSATGSLEGQWRKKYGVLRSLSEQNIVDCSKSYGNNGCNGGNMINSFKYIKANAGIDTNASYPYTATDNTTCKFTRAGVGANVTGYVSLPQGNETALQIAVATVGPISVAIDASSNFQFYSSGVYNPSSCSSTNLNHGVLVAGYGTTTTGTAYWQVKNSWGPSWGMNGYILMSRNKNNQCGIATYAVYPTV